MNSLKIGWKLGGSVGLRLAGTYLSLAVLCFYLQHSGGQWSHVWHPQRLVIAELTGSNPWGLVLLPFLMLIPLGLAWLAGAVSGFMTGMLAPLLGNRVIGRWWGMFCFFVPSLIFHNAAELRPQIVIGGHWLNSYWFWIGFPTLIAVLAGGWVGERVSGYADSTA